MLGEQGSSELKFGQEACSQPLTRSAAHCCSGKAQTLSLPSRKLPPQLLSALLMDFRTLSPLRSFSSRSNCCLPLDFLAYCGIQANYNPVFRVQISQPSEFNDQLAETQKERTDAEGNKHHHVSTTQQVGVCLRLGNPTDPVSKNYALGRLPCPVPIQSTIHCCATVALIVPVLP